MKRKLIANLLCLCMLVSLLPVAAFAGDEPTPTDNTSVATDPEFTAATENDLFAGKKAGDVQSGTMTITKNQTSSKYEVSGVTLKKITGWTDFNKALTDEQSGYYLAIAIPKTVNNQTISSMTLPGKDADGKAVEKQYTTTEALNSAFSDGSNTKCNVFIHMGNTESAVQTKNFSIKLKYGTDGAEATYSFDFSKVTVETPTVTVDAVPANLTAVEGQKAPAFGQASTYTAAFNATTKTQIDVTATDLKETTNTDQSKAYWVGVGLTTQDGATYAWGFGNKPANLKDTDYKAVARTQTTNNKTYTTLYWSTDDKTNPWSEKTGYISVKVGDKVTADYTVKFDVTTFSNVAIKGMGFEAVGSAANAAINNKVPTLVNPVTDCDNDTMYVYFNDVVSGTEAAPATLVVTNKDGKDVYKWESKSSGNIARVIYFTFEEGGSPASQPIASGKYTATLTIGNNAPTTANLTLNSVTINKADGTQGAQTTTYYENGAKFTLADNLTKANSVFTGWKDDKGATVAAGEKTVTADVTYTAQWDDVRIDKSVNPSLKDEAGTSVISGVTATVTEDTAKKTGVITLTGSIAQPADNTGTKYKLAYTTNEKEGDTYKPGTLDVTLKYEGGKVVPTVTNGTVGAYTYTVNAEALKVLPTNVVIDETSKADVEKTQVTVTGITEAALKTDLAKTTATFDTQNSSLSEKLGAEAAKLSNDTTKNTLLAEGQEKAGTSGSPDTSYDTIAVVPVLQIEQASYNGTDKTMTLQITPAIQYQAIDADNTGKPAVPVGNPVALSKADAANIGPVTISFAKPAFVTTPPTTGSKLYVTHNASTGTTYEYDATWNVSASAYSFENPHGFSEFVVSETSSAVASIGTGSSLVKYMNIQDAVNAVANNGTITLLKELTGNDAVVTISGKDNKTVNFVLSKELNDVNKTVTLKVNGSDVAVGSAGNKFEYTYKEPENNNGGGGGVSSNVTIDRPTNGKVTVTPTAPSKGATVTINLTPDTGYTVGTVTVTDKDGKAVELTKVNDTKYTFTMPDGKVKVAATFTKVDTPPATGFTDVDPSAYYADAVKWAVDKGITNGLTATTFGPNNSCTRGQMVTFLWRAAGSPAATGTNSFSDVASGEYYYNAVLWAVEKGITNGTSATTFSPNATVNRGQTVTFLYRYAESPAATGDTSFTDVTADAFYADAVKWAVAEGITNGTSDTTFAPASNCTRGQIVTFMYRQMAE